MTTSVCSERQLSKTRDTDVSNSSHQWIQKWFLKSRGSVSGLLKLHYLLCKQHPHRDQTQRHSTWTGKTQDLFPMGNYNILCKALFWIRTTRRNLEISRTKDIVGGKKGREAKTFISVWNRRVDCSQLWSIFCMFSYSEGLRKKSLLSGVLTWRGRTKPWTRASKFLCQGEQSEPPHTAAAGPRASHF